jgi:hypothetical protein
LPLTTSELLSARVTPVTVKLTSSRVTPSWCEPAVEVVAFLVLVLELVPLEVEDELVVVPVVAVEVWLTDSAVVPGGSLVPLDVSDELLPLPQDAAASATAASTSKTDTSLNACAPAVLFLLDLIRHSFPSRIAFPSHSG